MSISMLYNNFGWHIVNNKGNSKTQTHCDKTKKVLLIHLRKTLWWH